MSERCLKSGKFYGRDWSFVTKFPYYPSSEVFFDLQELESCVEEDLWTETFKQGTQLLQLIKKLSTQYPITLRWANW